jgi:DNA-directed RNA polymerase specialized sigma24 family protein
MLTKPVPPVVSDYIGECFWLIATRLSTKANFARYPFREDMVGDAVENCLRYMHNFNPKKSQNPFAYFTQYAHNAFIRRIEAEKGYTTLKMKYGMHQVHTGSDYTSQRGETYHTRPPAWVGYENVREFVNEFDEKMARGRQSRQDARQRSREVDASEFDLLDEDAPLNPGEDDMDVDMEVARQQGLESAYLDPDDDTEVVTEEEPTEDE